jgi:hypothetical protein
VHENQKKRAEQELVSYGIEVLANLGLLFQEPRGKTIETIAEPSDEEQAQRGPIVSLEDCDHQKRYETEAEKSEQVGGRT